MAICEHVGHELKYLLHGRLPPGYHKPWLHGWLQFIVHAAAEQLGGAIMSQVDSRSLAGVENLLQGM